ncbi:MAG: shikimate dehydrogenase [Myxococcota bacterium]
MLEPITPATQLCGILLHPAGHTRSPAMHNAAFDALGIDARYLAFDVPPEALADAIRGARALGIRQLAISIPHKQAVLPLLDEVEDTARAIGAVNTVTWRDGKLHGANTEWLGVVRALERETTLADARAVVLGAGGTARAATFGLLQRGARVTVLNRTPARAEELARALGADAGGDLASLSKYEWDVLVHTTSVGLGDDASPVPPESLRAGTVVLDAVYEPADTRLLRDAAAKGARTVGGKWMLIEQAAVQFEMWTGREAPREVLERAFDEAGAAS